jgi:hypothetical protein
VSIDNPWNLDPTAPASNTSVNSVFIGENMQMANINNGMRQIASFLAQATSYKSADLSTSVSTNVAAAGTGLYMDLTGANAVNHFGSPAGAEQPNAAVFRFLQYDSSASVSHGANIKLIGGVSRKMQPGDIQGVIHEGAGVWREFCFGSATGSLPMDSLSVTTITNRSMSTSAISTVTLNAASASITGLAFTTINATSVSASVGSFGIIEYGSTQLTDVYVQTKQASTAASISTSDNIPFDTSIPQNSEGLNIFSVSITPRNASSILEIHGLLYANAVSGAGNEVVAALFLDNAANAIFAASAEEASNGIVVLPIYFEHTASTTSEHIYALRYGADAGSARLNTASGNNLGGVMRSWLRVKERLP